MADSCHLYFGEGIESVDVKPVKFLRQSNAEKVDQERYPSLLGMDVLRNYKISFSESKVMLERESRSWFQWLRIIYLGIIQIELVRLEKEEGSEMGVYTLLAKRSTIEQKIQLYDTRYML